MSIWSILKSVSLRGIFMLTMTMIRKPLLMLPTLKATKRTMYICNALYGGLHHNNGRENAFRHALWNVLMCCMTYRITKDREKSINWAKKVTDLHERLAPNPPMEEAMDLHNNAMGRKYFYELNHTTEEDVIDFLKKQVDQAIKVCKIEDIQGDENDLVYISEE